MGDFSVGKTSLIKRYVDDTFDDSYLTTIGVKISKKRLTIDQDECELLIWDIEGATPQKKIPESYMHGATGAIFVTDCSREDTNLYVNDHIQRFLTVNPKAKYVLAHNKSDLLTDQQKQLFRLKTNSFFTSAKNDINVKKLFTTLTQEILS